MKRTIWISLLAALAFAIILLVRLPASWLSGSLPAGVSCGHINGTIWNGVCSGLNVQNTALGDLKWKLRPAALLSGRLASQVALDGPAGVGTSEVELRRNGELTARNVRANLPLNPAVIRALPANLRGNIETDLALLRFENRIVTGIEGRIDVRDLEQRGAPNSNWGDYVVSFPPLAGNGEPVGDLRSVKGPLEIEGKLRLTREPGYVLDGFVAPRAGASPELVQQLGMLGTPDAQGRRPFSVAGTF
jgi:general secretion pathway protein N